MRAVGSVSELFTRTEAVWCRVSQSKEVKMEREIFRFVFAEFDMLRVHRCRERVKVKGGREGWIDEPIHLLLAC